MRRSSAQQPESVRLYDRGVLRASPLGEHLLVVELWELRERCDCEKRCVSTSGRDNRGFDSVSQVGSVKFMTLVCRFPDLEVPIWTVKRFTAQAFYAKGVTQRSPVSRTEREVTATRRRNAVVPCLFSSRKM